MTPPPNRLADSTSPYLLQHADNPVDWYPWSQAAFDEAARRDVPILLSVGYASCHWCHVMAHESFEDPDTAAEMNRLFVNVKVDREERPDVDRIYMDAVQAMTGRGGWPMTVFLTPDGRPFHAGTYYPATARAGHPSFRTLLEAIDEAWRTRRTDIDHQARRLTQAVAPPPGPSDDVPGRPEIAAALEQAAMAFDDAHGGFGGAPKFPQAPLLEFLLRMAPESEGVAAMLHGTLASMARGGIHDLIGGGFARYTVDDRWLVPHFEKMLYDNAQLARIYALASVALDTPEFASVARTTLEYMSRDLALPEGGLASGEDADSEGVEGKFYVFSHEEFRSVTEDDAVAAVLGVTPAGNFEGDSILHRARTVAEVAADRDRDPAELTLEVERTIRGLAEIRGRRIRPGLDDKAVCSWNALAIRAYADAGRWLGQSGYLDTARRIARFVLEHLVDDSGRLQRAWREGRTSGPGFCDDYGTLGVALFSLYAATGETEWYDAAERTTREMLALFHDGAGGFFATGSDTETLIARPKNVFDSPTPSDNAIAAEALQHLAAYTGDGAIHEALDATLRTAGQMVERHPLGSGHSLAVAATRSAPPLEVALVGSVDARRPLMTALHSRFRPHLFLAIGDGTENERVPLLAGRSDGGGAQAYVCHDLRCEAPVATPAQLTAALA
jgi:uncharacterized protein YyaL (SSP411 family)